MQRLLRAEDVAEACGWHLMTVYRRARAGEIPGVIKLGRSVRFREAELEEWLNGGKGSEGPSEATA